MRSLARSLRGAAALITASTLALAVEPASAKKATSKGKNKAPAAAPVEPAAEPAPATAPEPPPPRPMSAMTPAELDAAAQASFDGGEYRAAAEKWRAALSRLPERPETHLKRSVMLQNAVTAYRQVHKAEGDRLALLSAREVVYEYLRRCKAAHALRCDGIAETRDAKALLAEVNAEIDATEEIRPQRLPPEYNVAVGGRPLADGSGRPPLPSRVVPSIVGGTLLAAGGVSLLLWGMTSPRFEGTAGGDLFERADGDTTGGDTTGGATSTSTVSTLDLTPAMRGKIVAGLGITALAVGVGFIVIGAIDLAKHRRLNRRDRVAASPVVGPQGAGLVISGRF